MAKLKECHDTNKMATNICMHTMGVAVLLFPGTRFQGQVAVSKEGNGGNSSSSISYNNDKLLLLLLPGYLWHNNPPPGNLLLGDGYSASLF